MNHDAVHDTITYGDAQMAFMKLEVTAAAPTRHVDCPRCCTTIYEHAPSSEVSFGEDGGFECPQCGHQVEVDPTDIITEDKPQYAARYSAPGYMDCTDWWYGKDLEKLKAEVDEAYGGEDEDTPPE